MSSPSIAKPSLPNELLSYIVLEALRSPRLNVTTDELFIQPKCRIAFTSLSQGFGGSCRKYRAILLREWFRVFHVYELEDIEMLIGRNARIIRSVNITGFIRELYFHQPMNLLPRHFNTLHSLHSISYPLRDNQPTSASSNTDSILPILPFSLQALELRDALNCSPEELRLSGISNFNSLIKLKVSCGESGAWAPVPIYGNGDAGAAMKRLAKSYIDILSPLTELRSLSLDIHLSDNTIFHDQPSPILGANIPLPANTPTQANPPPTQTEPECTGNNLCSICWEARRSESQQREILLAKTLGKSLKWLNTVEWTIWYLEKGRGEEKRRITLERNWNGSRPSISLISEGSEEKEQADICSRDLKPLHFTEDDLMFSTMRIPLALYPGVLG